MRNSLMHDGRISKELREVRRRQRADLRNHLRSIHQDAEFVDRTRRVFASLPLFGNLHNGMWYCRAPDGACYFKSTDGHYREWDFSMNRLNLNVVEAAASHGGVLIVDSTRAGKRFPDALTKTVPIWCAVMNRVALDGGGGGGGGGAASDRTIPDLDASAASAAPPGAPLPPSERPAPEAALWDTRLHTHPGVPASERAQIEERMPAFCARLRAAPAAVSRTPGLLLRRPLRPLFVGPSDPLPLCLASDCDPEDARQAACRAFVNSLSFTPVICICASEPTSAAAHREHHSWTYVQGAGDDEAFWSRGLRPHIVWWGDNAQRLMEAESVEEAEGIVRALVRQEEGRGVTVDVPAAAGGAGADVGAAQAAGSADPSAPPLPWVDVCMLLPSAPLGLASSVEVLRAVRSTGAAGDALDGRVPAPPPSAALLFLSESPAAQLPEPTVTPGPLHVLPVQPPAHLRRLPLPTALLHHVLPHLVWQAAGLWGRSAALAPPPALVCCSSDPSGLAAVGVLLLASLFCDAELRLLPRPELQAVCASLLASAPVEPDAAADGAVIVQAVQAWCRARAQSLALDKAGLRGRFALLQRHLPLASPSRKLFQLLNALLLFGGQ